jgi:hypothetical protein
MISLPQKLKRKTKKGIRKDTIWVILVNYG